MRLTKTGHTRPLAQPPDHSSIASRSVRFAGDARRSALWLGSRGDLDQDSKSAPYVCLPSLSVIRCGAGSRDSCLRIWQSWQSTRIGRVLSENSAHLRQGQSVMTTAAMRGSQVVCRGYFGLMFWSWIASTLGPDRATIRFRAPLRWTTRAS